MCDEKKHIISLFRLMIFDVGAISSNDSREKVTIDMLHCRPMYYVFICIPIVVDCRKTEIHRQQSQLEKLQQY